MQQAITKIWFDSDYLYGRSDKGEVFRQPLRWYPRLQEATDKEREEYFISTIGIHWRNIDEDVSFESFEYKEDDKLLYYCKEND